MLFSYIALFIDGSDCSDLGNNCWLRACLSCISSLFYSPVVFVICRGVEVASLLTFFVYSAASTAYLAPPAIMPFPCLLPILF